MSAASNVSASLQDYLEAILRLAQADRPARVRDIAEEVSVHKSTVSAALKALAERGLVKYSPYEIATLTPAGRRIAESVSQSHSLITRFLTDVLLIEAGAAGANACRMEHVMDQSVLDRLKLLARFVERRAGAKAWRSEFRGFLKRSGKDA